ncbi:MAG: RIP metalloprotease RseP, partial [Pseudomonadota bacterium]|nr:RIP metalloprotease RseP [Pseudomonadota bacterium]
VLAIDGRRMDDAAQVRDAVRSSGSGAAPLPMRWQIERQGERRELVVTPAIGKDGQRRVGRLEIVTGKQAEMVTVSYGFVDGITSAFTQTWQTSALTLKMIGRILTGRASLKNLSGPVSIADYAGQSARIGFVFYLGFLAAVSISLGVINLLPLPVLDGGQLMYYLFEAVTGSPVTGLWLRRLQQSGLVVIVAMMSLALYNDVTRLMGQQ